jgi:lipopolysaccharide export system permease protein
VRGEIMDPSDPKNLSKMRPGIRAQQYPLTFDVGKLLAQYRLKRDFSDLTFVELLYAIGDLRSKGIFPASLYLEAHKRIAGSLACLAFVLIGIPLGVKTQRRETSIGVAISLLLALGYYFFVILAETFKNKPQYYAEWILWSPNLVFELLGLILIWRVSRA